MTPEGAADVREDLPGDVTLEEPEGPGRWRILGGWFHLAPTCTTPVLGDSMLVATWANMLEHAAGRPDYWG